MLRAFCNRMTSDAYHRPIIPLAITFLGGLFYVFMLWAAVPTDMSASRYWEGFFRLRTGQISGLAFATCLYIAGLTLCVVAFSAFLPIRSRLFRRLLSIPGVLLTGFGALMVFLVLGCFIDKVR